MCGIIGLLGEGEAAPRLLKALKRLEYRGYDSAGIATLDAGRLTRVRAAGKLAALEARLAEAPPAGAAGVGHTRWATHGPPTEGNAHPHLSGRTTVVHNGIIENFAELRAELEAAGRVFETDTDTEVIAHLVDQGLEAGAASPADAVRSALQRLRGAFAIAFLFAGEDDLLIVARQGSPLAIGRGEGEMFVGSDAYALAPFTNRVAYLEDGDWAVVRRSGFEVFNAAGAPVVRPETISSAAENMADKGGHRHFMAKEIHEQPDVVGHTLARYLDAAQGRAAPPAEGFDFARLNRLTISGCGTAYYAGLIARYWFESWARMPVDVDVASELRYRDVPYPADGGALFISQSGETADTLAALRAAKENGQTIAALVNVGESSIAREADVVFPTVAGPEIGVASTKAFTCQLAALAALAVAAGRARGVLSAEDEQAIVRDLLTAPRLMAEALVAAPQIEAIAVDLAKARDILYVGRGVSFPLALEGALKLKEITYIHAEGYAAGELKHGPIALVDEKTPIVVIAPPDGRFEKTVSNMHEVIAREGRALLISDRTGIDAAGDKVWRTIKTPAAPPLMSPLVYAPAIQLLAYFTATTKGTDVDQPRNLAKSVTVE